MFKSPKCFLQLKMVGCSKKIPLQSPSNPPFKNIAIVTFQGGPMWALERCSPAARFFGYLFKLSNVLLVKIIRFGTNGSDHINLVTPDLCRWLLPRSCVGVVVIFSRLVVFFLYLPLDMHKPFRFGDTASLFDTLLLGSWYPSVPTLFW